jgi:hypothetical protein
LKKAGTIKGDVGKRNERERLIRESRMKRREKWETK